MLFFHDQDLTEDEQLAFASTFGPVGQYPLTKMFGGTAMSSTIEDTADSPPDADGWHTDVTWVAEPPAYAVLNAKVIPERGGDTMWASLFAAYDALSPVMQDLCCRLDGASPLRRRLPRARGAHHGRRGRRADHGRVPAGRASARAHASGHRSPRAVPVGSVHGPDRRDAPRRERRAARVPAAPHRGPELQRALALDAKATSRSGTKRARTTARCPTTIPRTA